MIEPKEEQVEPGALGPPPVFPPIEQPTEGDPFAFRTAKGERIDVAAGGPWAHLLKGFLKETAPIAVDASREAIEKQAQILAKSGLMETAETAAERAAKEAAGEVVERKLPKYAININLDRINDPDQINGVIYAVADELKESVDLARRGTISHAETIENATALFQRDEGFILRRNVGEAVNAEQITATRLVLATARDRTTEFAKRVVAGDNSAEALLGFRQSLSTLAAVQMQLHGMAAEAGRALNAYRIPANSGVLELAGLPGGTRAAGAAPVPPIPPAAAAGPVPGAAAAPPPTAAGEAAGAAQAAAPPVGSAPGAPTAPAAAGASQPGAAPAPAPGAGPLSPKAAQAQAKAATAGQVAATQDIQALIDLAGGNGGILKMAQGFLDLPHNAARNSFARASTVRGPADMVGELWYNFVLSGPATHMVNMTGNAITLGVETAERAVAARIGKLFGFMGAEQGVQRGEAAAMIQSYWGALHDAWKLANFAFRHGETVGRETGYQMPLSVKDIWKMSNADAQKLADPAASRVPGKVAAHSQQPAITGENVLNAGAAAINAVSNRVIGRDVADPALLKGRGALGRMTDLMSTMVDVSGAVLRTPTRMLGAEDQFWKTISYRGEASARAWREGVDRGMSGKQLEEYVAEAVNFMTPADDAAAEAFARRVTMSETLQSRFGRSLQQAGSSKLGFLFAPFVRVSTNILDFSTQRVAFGLRPKWWADALGTDPVARDLAMAKAATGGLMWMGAFAAASTGMDADDDAPVVVTGAGPTDPALKKLWMRRGYRDYSVRLGGKDGQWVQYSRLDPAGQMLGIAADSVNLMSKMDDVTAEEFAAALVAAIGNNVVNKTYMASIAEGMEVFTSYDPEMWRKWLQGKVTGFTVPNALSQLAQEQDPYLRRAVTIAEEMDKRKSAESKRTLPLVRDVAGYPIKQEWLFGTRFSGISASDSKPDPVAEELLRLQMKFTSPDRNMRGFELDEHQYDRYQELAGHALKMPKKSYYFGEAVLVKGQYKRPMVRLDGLGMWEAIGELMKLPEYKAATDGVQPPGQKVAMIRDIQSKYLEAAQERLMHEYPELVDAMVGTKQKAEQAKGKHPVMVENAVRVERMTLKRRASAASAYEVVDDRID